MVQRLPEQGDASVDPQYAPPVRVDMGPDMTGVTRITKIGVWHGELDPGYIPPTGFDDLFTGFIVYYERNGVSDFRQWGSSDHVWGHGKRQPIQLETINLSPDEYITTVRGFYGRRIWQFGFETNLPRRFGLYGTAMNDMKPLYFEAGPGNQIIGFYGSYIPQSGVASLGVYVKPLDAPPNPGNGSGGNGGGPPNTGPWPFWPPVIGWNVVNSVNGNAAGGNVVNPTNPPPIGPPPNSGPFVPPNPGPVWPSPYPGLVWPTNGANGGNAAGGNVVSANGGNVVSANGGNAAGGNVVNGNGNVVGQIP